MCQLNGGLTFTFPGPLKDAWMVRNKKAVLDVAIAMRRKVKLKATKKVFKRIFLKAPKQGQNLPCTFPF